MKTRTLLQISAAIVAGGFITAGAVGGPGPDYWRNQGKTAINALTPPAAPKGQANVDCTDARVVPVTETKFIQANGRGPLRTVEVGKKQVCTACAIPTIVMKPSGHNARGAMAPVASKGTHDCTTNDCTPATGVARID